MKKVLILAYDFPPYVSVGALRPYSWYKRFKEFGLYPVVITRQWENKFGNQLDYISPSVSDKTVIEETEFGTILRTNFRPNIANKMLLKFGDKKFGWLRKIITLYYEIFQFIFTIGNKKNLYIEAQDYLRNNKVDYIIATGEPFVLFHYADKLSRKYNVPWMADYRDPWVLNTQNLVNPMLKPWFTIQEKKILKTVNLIVTVSEFLGQSLNRFVLNRVEIAVLPNGYDQDSMNELNGLDADQEILTFAYAGMIYPYHPYEEFFSCLVACLKQNSSFKFVLNFYGLNVESQVKDKINIKYPELKDYIKFYPRLPNAELVKCLATSHALILFNEYSFMGTKIYDYLGVKRMILHCFTNYKKALDLKKQFFPMSDDIAFSNRLQQDLIEMTHSGICVSDGDDLKATILNLFEAFNRDKTITLSSRGTEEFSRKNQTKKLATLLNAEILKHKKQEGNFY